MKTHLEKVRLILLPAILAGFFGFLLSDRGVHQPVHAFSSGPPAGYTGAPSEEPEACAECHVPPDAGTGQISISAPQTYIPGQTFQITVTHTNADPTRLRWGFQLTALDPADEKAGNLQSADAFTQVLDDAGPSGTRQYIEHTQAGTFAGQQNGASWTFNWTAPDTDVGVITFYAAGNHANNDGNTSGDHIYRTFVASAPASSTPDFVISATPSSRAITPGESAQYTVTVTPFAGFTGVVSLDASGLPAGATASFSPATVNLTDATSETSTLTITTTGGTPIGNNVVNVTGAVGMIAHSAQVTLKVISASSVDVALSKTASPNPGQVGDNLSYRLAVTNNGPATATNLVVTDTLPGGVAFLSASSPQFLCSGTNTVSCTLVSLAAGASAAITIVVNPSTSGQIINTAVLTVNESDFDLSNNSSSATTFIQTAAIEPTMVDPNLDVRTVFSGLDQPTTLAFLGTNDFFVLEKATGEVKRIVNGVLQSTVLDLAVNSASERGLLGIARHPQFASNGFVYLFWTESNTGSDTTNVDAIAPLGNRVDRYIWNGTTLTFDRNLIKLRALQQDAGQPSRGNHDGGILRFGPDNKLYVLFGDNGRRGFLQNIVSGGPVPDDQFGGPEPDNAHMTSVILRLNDDGTTPTDNPFFNATTGLTGEAAANVKKIFAYGIRNGFGMAFDPVSGILWTQENGDDAFDEMNRVPAGFNGGWIQIMGPLGRLNEFKSIESTYGAGNLQQNRWPPSNIAGTPQLALSRLFMLPGARYIDPEFSWKYAVAPSTLGFVNGSRLGPQYQSDMFVGASRTTLLNGYLFRFDLTNDRQHFTFSDPRLADLVADNTDKFDLLESESLVAGRDFGVTTDIQTGPNGNLFVVSLSNGAIYEIFARSNPIDDTQFFVRQHYQDFLDREPDPPGFTFWTNEIDSCGADVQCREIKRINVSAAFFLSIEFRDTGYLVYRMYKTAYGNLPNAPVPLTLNEFLPDKHRIAEGLIVGAPGWEQLLNNNKNAFASEFVARSRFTTAFPTSLTPAQFVDMLLMNAQITISPAERSSLINEFGVASATDDTAARARVLLRVAEHSSLVQQEFNRAFVLMQYFGYLRRNPNDSPDNDFSGYSFWLDKLNQFNGNFVQAEMVKAFIDSIEYRQRFGPQ